MSGGIYLIQDGDEELLGIFIKDQEIMLKFHVLGLNSKVANEPRAMRWVRKEPDLVCKEVPVSDLVLYVGMKFKTRLFSDYLRHGVLVEPDEFGRYRRPDGSKAWTFKGMAMIS